MSGQDTRIWLDYKYNGDIDYIEEEYKEKFNKKLKKEKQYDKYWEKEWNNLYYND